MKDMIGKNIQRDIMAGRIPIGEVGFKLENGKIEAVANARNLTKKIFRSLKKLGNSSYKAVVF